MSKQNTYTFCKYTDEGIIIRKYYKAQGEENDLIKEYEKIMGHVFDPEYSYIKPLIKPDMKINYTNELISQLLFDAAMNLTSNVKNKYAVADDIMDFVKILKKEAKNKIKKEKK